MSDLRESLTQSGTLIGYINTIVYAHNYNDLTNKPQINGVTLSGNKTASDLGLVTPQTEAVTSVNSKTGAVVLDGTDIAYDNSHTINQQIDAVAASIDYPVTSVNSKTGDVVLDGSDINYDGTYNVNQKIAAVEAEIPVVNYPVTSVNTKTGAVVLDGTDINYDASNTINQKIDAVAASIPVVSYPVTSVAGRTGDVELYATDIMCPDTATGSIATFTTSLEKPLVGCECGIVASGGGGTPTTPIPIVGYTGMTITRNDGQTPPVEEDTYSVSWQSECGTVYGGSLDVTSGVLTVDYVKDTLTVNEGILSSIYFTESGAQTVSVLGDCVRISLNRKSQSSNMVTQSSSYELKVSNMCPHNFNYGSDTPHWYINNQLYLYLPTTNVGTTLAEYRTFLENNPFAVLIKLATPVTYQLTPTEIETLVGTNNVFCDTNGNTNVTYLETIKEYIDKRVNP